MLRPKAKAELKKKVFILGIEEKTHTKKLNARQNRAEQRMQQT